MYAGKAHTENYASFFQDYLGIKRSARSLSTDHCARMPPLAANTTDGPAPYRGPADTVALVGIGGRMV